MGRAWIIEGLVHHFMGLTPGEIFSSLVHPRRGLHMATSDRDTPDKEDEVRVERRKQKERRVSTFDRRGDDRFVVEPAPRRQSPDRRRTEDT